MDSGLAAPGNKLSSPLLGLRTGTKPKSYRFKYRFNEAKAIRLQHEQIKGTIGCLIPIVPPRYEIPRPAPQLRFLDAGR
jgi:hypothetical protein